MSRRREPMIPADWFFVAWAVLGAIMILTGALALL
jgi:hypothetical protein